MLVLAVALATPAFAQESDIHAIFKRFQEFYFAGNYPAALVEAQKVEAAVKARVGTNHPAYAAALNNLAAVYLSQGKHGEAEELYKRALAIREQALGANHPDVAQTLNDLATVYAKQGKYDEAEGLYKRALAIREQALGANHPDVANVLNNLAVVYRSQGKYDEAEGLYKRALAIREQALGANHPDVAGTLNNLANVYQSQGKYGEAEGLYKRALAIREQALGANHPDVGQTLNNLANVYQLESKYGEAEGLYKRALAIKEQALGANHPDTAQTLNNLANVYQLQGKYDEAEGLYKRALAIEEQALGANHPEVAQTLSNLANVYQLQGKYGEAEGLFKRALAIFEQALGADHPDVAQTLSNLANVYRSQGKYSEAEELYKRALAIKEQALGANHPDVAATLNNLANVYQSQGKYSEAEELYKRALAIREQALGANHPDTAQTLNNLAVVYQSQGKYSEAEELYKRALAIREHALGADHADVAATLVNLAVVYQSQGKYSEAEGLYKRALAIFEQALGANHPDVATSLNNLAILYQLQGKYGEALTWSRKAIATVVAHGFAEAPNARQPGEGTGFVKQRADYFLNHVAIAAAAALQGIEPAAALAREAFESAQRASQSSAAAAIQQMAARFGSGGDALAALVRDSQDLAAAWRAQDKRLVDVLSKPEGQQNRTEIEALRQQIADIESRLAADAARLDKEFPDYAALASPKPLAAEEAQKLLGPDEALVFLLAGDRESYVFALTRDGFDWRTIPIGAQDLAAKVAAFRRGVDVDALMKGADAGRPELFDLGLAHELYATLLGPVDALIKDKAKLIVAPTGALTALPFHLLVTEKPDVAVPQLRDIAAYRNAAWLVKRQAVSVLPSVASLKALRALARKGEGAKPMVGFGDPVFDPAERAIAIAAWASLAKQAAAKSRPVATRAYSEFWQGAGVDRAQLAHALPSLLDTADELKAVASKLGASAADIHLGADASVTTVKRTALADYRVVYFATHGLIAGDVKGLGEPALALSIPAQPSDLDDGLLTASEVAQLKLNADWVVLSACNTAAGDKPGAEALSGLARAFFYAGGRALLVSHWSVSSDAAARLTTSTFDVMKSNPTVGRAEALRRAMLAYMNDKGDLWSAYPAFWGPFSLVGEGAVR
jgi:tetratricopeptide (TPR) repeat protein/CHAT domain-containing protein